MKQRLVVIGNGMAGMRTVDELIQIAPEKYDITVFGAEPHGNYNRIMLTPMLFGSKSIADIMIHDFAWYRKHDVTLHCGSNKTVVDVDRKNRRVIAEDGTTAEYDKLLIATGSLPLMLDIPGGNVDGVMGFRDIADVEAMIETSTSKCHALILGGGLLGLETANGLLQRGMQVTVLDLAPHLLNRQLDHKAADLLRRQLESKGINFRLGLTVAEILSQNQRITEVRLSDGTILPADLLVMATGIRPNIALARQIGLPCRRGIIVNDQLQTQEATIYAVGECVEYRGEVFGLVAPAYQQAKVCAEQLAGKSSTFSPQQTATTLKVTGVDLFSAGDFNGQDDCQTQMLTDPALGVYRKIVIKNDRVAGIILYGDTRDSHWYLNLIENQTNIADIRDHLIFNRPALAN
jgi:nitrite reductase (NADH) large subunit